MIENGRGSVVDRMGAGTLWAVVLGAGFAVAGAIAGLVLAMHKYVVDCPDGHIIEDGADPNCYAYPDTAQGVSIVFACLALFALILLAARILLLVTPRSSGPTIARAGTPSTFEAVVTPEPTTGTPT